jgi:hypothetical protein
MVTVLLGCYSSSLKSDKRAQKATSGAQPTFTYARVTNSDEFLLDALTPLGFRVLVTRQRWELITTAKHPVMADVSEETGDEVVLMKDRSGLVIGFEKLNFSVSESGSVHVALETTPA